uniref:Uncharacterized protein n=1 Tax=Corvus moneduloides TaxID=1196302 RepID=A0A8C3DQN0_CORMO
PLVLFWFLVGTVCCLISPLWRPGWSCGLPGKSPGLAFQIRCKAGDNPPQAFGRALGALVTILRGDAITHVVCLSPVHPSAPPPTPSSQTNSQIACFSLRCLEPLTGCCSPVLFLI